MSATVASSPGPPTTTPSPSATTSTTAHPVMQPPPHLNQKLWHGSGNGHRGGRAQKRGGSAVHRKGTGSSAFTQLVCAKIPTADQKKYGYMMKASGNLEKQVLSWSP